MDSDIGDKISAVLSDPEQMGKLAQMAKSLMGQTESNQAQEAETVPLPQQETGALAALGSDAKLLASLGKAFSGGQAMNSKSTALLMAMRPYMRPEKQEKLDKAMKIAQMVHIAGAVMQEYGGGHGI
ncbi:MAG: hypothetical protein LUH42_07720 [Oscillospiraceae bacterium]|nr:hypothetical protein [Oscillospiraceae bacterium]